MLFILPARTHAANLGNVRVLIVPVGPVPGAGPKRAALDSLMQLYRDRISAEGFRVTIPQSIEQRREDIALSIDDEQKMHLKFAKALGADCMVQLHLRQTSTPVNNKGCVLKQLLEVSVIDRVSGEVLGQKKAKGKRMAMNDPRRQSETCAYLARILGKNCMGLIDIMKSRYGSDTRVHVLFFHHLSPDAQLAVEDIFNDQGWDYNITEQVGENMRVEVRQTLPTSKIRYTIIKAARTKSVMLRPEEQVGTRVTFSGE